MGERSHDDAGLVRVLGLVMAVVPPVLMLGLADWSDLWTPAPGAPLFPWCLGPTVAGVVVEVVAGGWSARPARLGVRADRGEFRVPARVVTAVGGLLLAIGIALGPISTGRPDGEVVLLSAVPMLLLAIIGAGLAASPDVLCMSPSGLSLRSLPWRSRRWAWEELTEVTASVVPPRWWQRQAGTVRLRLPGLRQHFALGTAGVDARFLAGVIEYYRLHPEERSGIGTLDGYRRMTRAVGDWLVPDTVPSRGSVDG